MTNDISLPDDSTRPEPPVLDGLTEDEMAPARHLAMIHDHHRRNMRALSDLIAAARHGTTDPKQINKTIGNLSMVDNYRRFGTLCGQHCQIVHGHHSIEDDYLFPELGAKAAAFRHVVARLKQEHDVVHDLLMRLVDDLNHLLGTPDQHSFKVALVTYEQLETLLNSHFAYEERAIGPALGRYRIGV
ncbi:MAG: hemerythrin domain-containing protein [Alphaproteobacteria bacterium]|nr:hemerythrin domain-containing protein [Alphaproteobacteria bacterium]